MIISHFYLFSVSAEWNDVIMINLLAEHNNVVIRGVWLHTKQWVKWRWEDVCECTCVCVGLS